MPNHLFYRSTDAEHKYNVFRLIRLFINAYEQFSKDFLPYLAQTVFHVFLCSDQNVKENLLRTINFLWGEK